MTCLIVDDSDVVRKIIRNTMECLGFQADDVASLQEAQLRCKRSLPDLIFWIGKCSRLHPVVDLFIQREPACALADKGIAASIKRLAHA